MRKQIEWLHKEANIDIEDCLEELTILKNNIIGDLSKRGNSQFIPVELEEFKQTCNTLFNKINDWGIADRIAEIAIILQQGDRKYPIHRDFPSWKMRNIALNLPILNCHDSFTVWYDAELIGQNPAELGDNVYTKHSRKVDEETAIEIGRCISTIPQWINVFVPHAPRVGHQLPRVSISIRFHPELFDLVSTGYFEQNMIKEHQ